MVCHRLGQENRMAHGTADKALLKVLVLLDNVSVLVAENGYFGKIKTK